LNFYGPAPATFVNCACAASISHPVWAPPIDRQQTGTLVHRIFWFPKAAARGHPLLVADYSPIQSDSRYADIELAGIESLYADRP